MAKYRLMSSSGVFTPGLLDWAKNGYHFERDREQLLNVFIQGYGLTKHVAHMLLSGELKTEINGSVVEFEYGS